jgi:alanine dehydrogenase
VLPLQRILLVDIDHARAEDLAARSAVKHGVRVETTKDLRAALQQSEVCVTCTTSRRAFLGASDVAPGTFVAAVGADNPDKQELEPTLLASATLVVDVLDQCAEIGELHHALRAGVLTRERVHGELADVVVGRRPGRTSPEEITIFDSSGTALQDVAAAIAVFEKASASGRGVVVKLDA